MAPTVQWLCVVFDRSLTDGLTLCVTLSRPRRAVLTEIFALASAGSALALTAVWAHFHWIAVIGMACLPGLPALYGYLFRASGSPALLYLHPQSEWKIVSQDEQNIQSVQLIQCWQHFFGLTLSLKLLNRPHNKQETVRMTVWRCQIASEPYRRMCVMAAWRLDQPEIEKKLEIV